MATVGYYRGSNRDLTYLLMCISNPIPVFVSLGKCSNLITVSVKESFTLANTANIIKRHIYT